jgi:spermidine/putrescine transport system permease protein
MEFTQSARRHRFYIWGWTIFVLVVLYLPVLCSGLASLTQSRYFAFPIPEWSAVWWGKTIHSIEVGMLVKNSLIIAGVVTAVSVVLAFFGAMAFARYDWKGRKLFQKIVLLPIFFPQPVLGLALLLWFNALGIPLSMNTAIIAHLVWVAPVATLVMAIQAYSFDPTLEDAAFDLGANRWQVLTEVTIPVLWPGIWSGMLFAFLLSWGNFPLSLYTAGADATVPEWLYNKMIAGYTPMVPALGTMSTLIAAIVIAAGALGFALLRRRRLAREES